MKKEQEKTRARVQEQKSTPEHMEIYRSLSFISVILKIPYIGATVNSVFKRKICTFYEWKASIHKKCIFYV